MIVEMLPPLSRTLGRLQLAVMQRSGEALACPTCSEPMTPTSIHRVELDSCGKGHGVWFDVDELRIALLRVADPNNPSIVEAIETPPRRRVPIPRAPGQPPGPPPTAERSAPRLVFYVSPPEEAPYELAVQRHVLKLGKLETSHIRLVDEAVSRMHAVIEATDEGVSIIDLGSAKGTLVNGARVNRSELAAGDVLQLAGTTLELRSITPGIGARST